MLRYFTKILHFSLFLDIAVRFTISLSTDKLVINLSQKAYIRACWLVTILNLIKTNNFISLVFRILAERLTTLKTSKYSRSVSDTLIYLSENLSFCFKTLFYIRYYFFCFFIYLIYVAMFICQSVDTKYDINYEMN